MSGSTRQDLSRRHFLKLAGGVAGAAAVAHIPDWTVAAHAATLDPAPFTLGVASGEPTPHGVVLWTRLAPAPLEGGGMPDEVVPVRWELARDEGFRRIERRGTYYAQPRAAHSVHVQVSDLAPGRWYWYRFRAMGGESVVGRTRTLPPRGARDEPLRFAFASCQAWVGRPYPAYRDMAEQELDLVLHLGDYIYETARGDLAEFRRLHALYKTSPDLRAAHARFPFVTTWDDHEVQNNYAGDLPGAAGDGRPFLERRANAYQAYYEHLPLALTSVPRGPDMHLYRRFAWGRLADFSVLDTRQYRSDQPCGDGRREPCEETFDPERTMTGPEQERWLLRGLERSRARWNVVAQQTIMAEFDYDLGPGEVYNLDQWDGYPAARARILDRLAEVENPVVLSGDWHSNWVNDLKADFADPGSPTIATEFTGTSISSGIGWDAAVREGLDANPHVRFYEGGYRGYVLCDVTPERWETTLRIVTNPRDAAAPAYTLAAFEVAAGTPGAVRLDAGTGVAGRVTDTSGEPRRNVEITVRDATGRTLVERATDADGAFSLFVPPGSYAVEANGAGLEPASRTVTVSGESVARADLALEAVTLFAGAGRVLPGARAEGRAADVALENARLALVVSAGTEDGQLRPVTNGKPLDLAAAGHLDQLDWINLPYAALAQPRGTEAWQSRTVRSTSVEVTGPGTVVARGAATEVPALLVETTYALAAGQDFVQVDSAFSNTGAEPVTVWVGDAMDHDGSGQRSGVAGRGTIATPYGEPADHPPTGNWIGMTGTDGQTYGLVYADPGFGAYGNGNWIMSQRQVTIAPGETFVLRRRLVAASNGFGDPWAVLEGR